MTTPARTIADLRRVVPAPQIRRAIREAEVLGFDTGAGNEREGTRSELEHRFLRLCHKHRLPPPETNAQIGAFTVDFIWRQLALIVETDGYRFHRGRQAFEDDRTRDMQLRAMGFEVIRVTYRQVHEQWEQIAQLLRLLIRRRSSRIG